MMVLFKRLKNLNSLVLVLMAVLVIFVRGYGQEAKLGDVPDGGRATAVHRIKLYDETGAVILPDDQPLMPFSTQKTCGECHDYQKISLGWHFNAHNPAVAAGRPGQPWLLIDKKTATQLPLSYRPWPGCYRPDSLGLSEWEFVQKFGRYLTGGGIAADDSLQSPEYLFRWQVSGRLEVNCLACHDADAGYDPVEFADQVVRQNYRWAPTGASNLALVRGSARDMPDQYDIYRGSDPDNPRAIAPTVLYSAHVFDAQNKVFFDIAGKGPSSRCYFCHSNRFGAKNAETHWQQQEDVHLAAGLSCASCHRNGLNHAMTRGYADESAPSDPSAIRALTCKGCHLDDPSASTPIHGRYGAPNPAHAGIPPIHFDKLSCTACHSGPWPTEKAVAVRTSWSHALGIHSPNKVEDRMPDIVAPIFVKGENGQIAPHYLVWPAFWGRLRGKSVTPIAPAEVKSVAGEFLMPDSLAGPPNWPVLADSQIIKVLHRLALTDSLVGVPVYLSGGKLYRLNSKGKLSVKQHDQAQPYAWPLAHDVRPASQALGARSCRDCHGLNSAFFFGKVPIASMSAREQNLSQKMTVLQRTSGWYLRVFALSFFFRPWLKAIIIIAGLVIAGVVFLYLFQGLAMLTRRLADSEA